ncbi:hypothetical protein [Sphingobacterium thalpophilum]|uniref:Uncharacterized protein n=1 Tax=Sphingobacterium thalpophilum TaxID=259 RepID=A0A4U9VHM5_9SPHI|nr:hypothetical protein [Sphingobacterium thalpophilum]VTR44862.1 Uncharacterised protein [Sphingobacterium thalpophilum]
MTNYWFAFLLLFLSIHTKGQYKPVEHSIFIDYKVNDTLDLKVQLIRDTSNTDYYYHAFLSTDVCNDKVCLPVQVDLFWNLLGEYDHFVVPEGQVFTKFDHQYFDKADYDLLHKILLDTLSPIRDYAVEQFLDKTGQKYSAKLDGVTRPTLKAFSNVTVPGALYTVYALWHIVNGPVKSLIRHRLDSLYKEQRLETYFAKSTNTDYQAYFLKQLSPEQVQDNEELVVDLLFSADDYIPHYAWNKLGTDFYSNANKYNVILGRLDRLKPHVQLSVLERLSHPNRQTIDILNAKYKDSALPGKLKELIHKLTNNYEK